MLHRKNRVYEIVSVVIIVLLALLFLFPLYWIVTGAFKTSVEINSATPAWIPTQWVTDNFQRLMSRQKAPSAAISITAKRW